MDPPLCVDCSYWQPDHKMHEGRCHNIFSHSWSHYTSPKQHCDVTTAAYDVTQDDRTEAACLIHR